MADQFECAACYGMEVDELAGIEPGAVAVMHLVRVLSV